MVYMSQCLFSSHFYDDGLNLILFFQATARGFLIVLALSIHDYFEGIALGVETSTTATYFLLAAFASHKVVISGTVGLNWARSQVIIISLLSCLSLSLIYFSSTPLWLFST